MNINIGNNFKRPVDFYFSRNPKPAYDSTLYGIHINITPL